MKTSNFLKRCGPNDVIMATSEASRPREMSIRPILGSLWRASNVYQPPSRYASNQALKSGLDQVPPMCGWRRLGVRFFTENLDRGHASEDALYARPLALRLRS